MKITVHGKLNKEANGLLILFLSALLLDHVSRKIKRSFHNSRKTDIMKITVHGKLNKEENGLLILFCQLVFPNVQTNASWK